MAITLRPLESIDGFIGAALVDSESAMTMAVHGGGAQLDLDMAAAGNTEVVQAKRKTMKMLNLSDKIEDILITLGNQYHLIRPLESNDAIFLYVAVNRARANLAMARLELRNFEKTLEF